MSTRATSPVNTPFKAPAPTPNSMSFAAGVDEQTVLTNNLVLDSLRAKFGENPKREELSAEAPQTAQANTNLAQPQKSLDMFAELQAKFGENPKREELSAEAPQTTKTTPSSTPPQEPLKAQERSRRIKPPVAPKPRPAQTLTHRHVETSKKTTEKPSTVSLDYNQKINIDKTSTTTSANRSFSSILIPVAVVLTVSLIFASFIYSD
ncbi:MAG: hypothetical protein S4CHLAM7_03830 [Chlamydiae bacterium]|nr:hypothetical protein [Chlamydiota bacterium]